jgi:hypothetical protein
MKVTTTLSDNTDGLVIWNTDAPDNGVLVPAAVEVRAERGGQMLEFALRLDADGVVRTSDLRIVGPVDASLLRRLGVATAAETALAQTATRVQRDGRRISFDLFGKQVSPAEMRAALRSPARSRIDEPQLELTAQVYRAAVADGRRDATVAVADALGVSRATAARRVTEARSKGPLGLAYGTRAGEAQ